MSEIRRYHVVGGALTRKGRPDIGSPPPPPPPPGGRFPGDPNTVLTGELYYGQSRTGNGSVAFRETEMGGASVPIHRTYYKTIDQITPPGGNMFQTIRADHAANRMPLVSFRLDWAGTASGVYDAQLDAVIAEIESYAKPAFVILNHEPENDGLNAADWRAQQQRFRSRITSYGAAHGGIKRLSFGAALMAYTWSTASGRNPENWWAGAGVHDWLAADHYTQANAAILRAQFTDFVAWCKAKNQTWAVAEYGVRQEDTAGPTKMQSLYDYCRSRDCVFISYFDSDEGTYNWILTDTNGALTKHRQLMQRATTVRLSDLGF